MVIGCANATSLSLFHPVIQEWFRSRFAGPTEPQEQGWPQIVAGRDILIAAPTGSGKTLTAFLAAIDRLFQQAEQGCLGSEIRVVYISPLRALSNDMHRNLEQPLSEILALAEEMGLEIPPVRVGLRTGDTTAAQRAAIVRRPPHILVTTPESLYLMLSSPRSREALQSVETVIVDEIHALVRDKRGSHLAITLERLAALSNRPLQRIGLSATQRPMDRIARFLVGCGPKKERVETSIHVPRRRRRTGLLPFDDEVIVTLPSRNQLSLNEAASPTHDVHGPSDPTLPVILDIGHRRELDLAIEVPPSELGAVCMHEQWAEVNERIVELIQSHRATLIFVNTRRLAERLTHQLSELLGEDVISSHHGSLAYKHRHDTEQRLKSGQLKAVVATASLEMGIDVGYVDLVIQIGSPRNIATFLQRIGRSGHALGLIPKGRLFALTRDELFECMAIMRAIRAGRLDIVPIPVAPLDVLAQQIVAEVACQEYGTDQLFDLVRRAAPYSELTRYEFDRIIRVLSEGMTPGGERSRVFLHHDQVGRRVRARPGARMAAIANAGAIPEVFAIRVVTEEDHTVVGSVDEDFGTESQSGDIFLLGNTSWRIRYLRGGDLFVTDAGGAPPTIPFWRGEAPGRTYELSEEVSRLREDLEARIDDPAAAEEWLVLEAHVNLETAHQAVEYVRAQKAAIGLIPTIKRVVFERFFDESGGMQLVIHAPFGTRITRAWGLAMRKRFCRSFDFELQANADDDGIVLSLGPQHSFPLESMFPMLNPKNVQALFEQAVLVVPIFQNRWRWNATRALQVSRAKHGKKVPPALQRFRSEDLLTAVFPKLTGCQEHVVGDIELPDHPLVKQTMDDCLYEAHDMDALKEVLRRVEQGEIEFIARDTREPSPFSYELINANPYAFLDGGEVAERRARAVSTRRSLSVESVQDLGRLDPEAIFQVVLEAQPFVRNPDELHDALLSRILLPESEGVEWREFFNELATDGRATLVTCPTDESPLQQSLSEKQSHSESSGRKKGSGTNLMTAGSRRYWAATERVPAILAVFPGATLSPAVKVPVEVRHDWESTDARVAIVRGLLETCGPITGKGVSERTGITESQASAALEALEGEGVVLRGRFQQSAERGMDPDAEQLKIDAPDESGEGRHFPSETTTEWCHRRLLARIHRLTLDGLRKQIEPVSVEVYIRFLTRHHGVSWSHRRAGANGLFEVIAQLQGIDIPSVAWERDILPLRIDNYQSEWLDELCLTGEVGWGRLFPPPRNPEKSRPMASLTRVAPISLFLRQDAEWLCCRAPEMDVGELSSVARQVYSLLQQRGAMFAADLLVATRMLQDHLEDALGELVTRGILTADGFAGLRSLVGDKTTPSRKPSRLKVERKRTTKSAIGRWAIRPVHLENTACPTDLAGGQCSVPAGTASIAGQAAEVRTPTEDARVRATKTAEDWAWQLLRRWGVVFRDLLAREDGAPPWFDLLQVLRRLEARGEIRGGRFIAGVAGEQFALADSVQQLRRLRDEGPTQELIVISAADPLNLVGIVTRQERVPRTASNRVAYLDGTPVAYLQGGEVYWLAQPPREAMPSILNRLRHPSLVPVDPASKSDLKACLQKN
ncbi:DEAD/DEAH box helicase [Schlesneria sp.]|uniref:DEAD/DEAH box helicase n=1 Tax=Schlesneria sp. TaxID=2762018 RepID=UPI003F7E1540